MSLALLTYTGEHVREREVLCFHCVAHLAVWTRQEKALEQDGYSCSNSRAVRHNCMVLQLCFSAQTDVLDVKIKNFKKFKKQP